MVEIDLRRRDERPASDAALDQPAPLEALVGLADRHPADAQRRRELALRRAACRPGRSVPRSMPRRDLLLDLLVGRVRPGRRSIAIAIGPIQSTIHATRTDRSEPGTGCVLMARPGYACRQ